MHVRVCVAAKGVVGCGRHPIIYLYEMIRYVRVMYICDHANEY